MELPPSPAPCGCSGHLCLFGDDCRGSADADADADWCGVVSWPRAAALVRENEHLLFSPERLEAMERWVRETVAPRWKSSAAKAALSDGDYGTLSNAVHRVVHGRPERLRAMPRYRPAFQFVMKHPLRANPNTASSIMLKMSPPVRWIEATRGSCGTVSYRRDDARVPVDMKAMTPETYGQTWAEAVVPSAETPAFVHPDRLSRIPEEDRHWYAYSPGVCAWVPARRSGRDDFARWYQKFPDPPCGVDYPIMDVGSEFGDEVYGRDVGVLAPLYAGDTQRVYDRLVLHPQYQAKWLGVYEREGRFFAYSYPDDAEIACDLRPENFGQTWCWPPSLTGDLDDDDNEPDRKPAEAPAETFAVLPTDQVLGPDGALVPGADDIKVWMSPQEGWVDASPDGDRKSVRPKVDGGSRAAKHKCKCKRKTYGVAWVAVARRPAIPGDAEIPFRAAPSNEPGSIWAVRHGSGWVIARLGEDWRLGQVGAKHWRVEARGEYGRDHGEVATWKEGHDEFPSGTHVLVRHPILRGEWIPARRENNRWWIAPGDYGGRPVLVRDPMVGTPAAAGFIWRFSRGGSELTLL